MCADTDRSLSNMVRTERFCRCLTRDPHLHAVIAGWVKNLFVRYLGSGYQQFTVETDRWIEWASRQGLSWGQLYSIFSLRVERWHNTDDY